jgi:hypothetical protein
MELRPYQIPIFTDNTTGILGLYWAHRSVLSPFTSELKCLRRASIREQIFGKYTKEQLKLLLLRGFNSQPKNPPRNEL